MSSDLDKEPDGSVDDAEFEASLISDVNSELAMAETQIAESAETPPPIAKNGNPPRNSRPGWERYQAISSF